MNVKLNSKYEFPFNMNIKNYTKAYYDDELIKSKNLPKDNQYKNNENTDNTDTNISSLNNISEGLNLQSMSDIPNKPSQAFINEVYPSMNLKKN